ncbi:MAG TPA: glycosyltransferase family 4 protein [Polyangiaceae bacterium]|nr:glycosyltransferase family 4 protein [Polyangiaceae bacterium]
MRVMVSCAGAFHSFHLAEQLDAAGALARLVTTYPKGYLARRFAVRIDPSRISTDYLQLAIEALGRMPFRWTDPSYAPRQLHDAWAARRVTDDLQIVVGWSGCSLRTLREANRQGALSVVVRGSSHVEEQMAILQAAYDRCGVPFSVPHRTVAQELEEYAVARFIQTNSTFAKRTFVARGVPEEQIIMCTTGVNLERFRPHPKDDATFRFVYAGACTIRKGTHLLLEAFSRLGLPDAELWLIGGVTDEIVPFLRRYEGPKVRVFGLQPQAKLAQLLSQGSVFVLPSLEEGLATVQAQAMACGLPLLCTPNTGGEDFLSGPGVEGVVVPAGDAAALAEAMLDLYSHPDAAREMGRRALDRVARGFTWEAYGRAIIATYRSLLDRRRAPGVSAATA